MKGPNLEMYFKMRISRKRFLKLASLFIGSLAINNLLSRSAFSREILSNGRNRDNIKRGDHDIVIVKGDNPSEITKEAIEGLGGMERFVKKGSVVFIKPNMSWDRFPEQAANTNPELIASLVEMCFMAGARRVNIFDRTCNEPKRCYENSGIARLAREKGADVHFVDEWDILKMHFSYKSPLEGWPVYREAIECDTFINVPILKHHSLTGLTLSMKNLMGICSGNRANFHLDIGIKLVHLTDFIRPDLTLIDAYRILKDNGPSGGRLEDVVTMKTVIAGTDPVLCDAYACRLVAKDPMSISYIKEAFRQKLNSVDMAHADVLTINI